MASIDSASAIPTLYSFCIFSSKSVIVTGILTVNLSITSETGFGVVVGEFTVVLELLRVVVSLRFVLSPTGVVVVVVVSVVSDWVAIVA